jgi:molybdate transport system ATP-binding protein
VSLLEFRCRLRYASGFTLKASFSTTARVTALFGPSGSGKSSVLSVIAGLRRPEEGVVRLGTRTLAESTQRIYLPPEARRIGYVFQAHLLFPHLSVHDNLLYGWRRRAEHARPVDFQRVAHVLDLADLLNRFPHTLSGGERQRVALGRALLCGPELLLLDEPLASVDDARKQRVLDYVERMLEEWRIPTLYVTHDSGEVRRLAENVVVLQDGWVSGSGTPTETL